MACITLKGPNGERTIPEGEPYKLLIGEAISGIVWDCGYELSSGGSLQSEELSDKLHGDGVQWGSAIKWVTSQLGIKQCSACHAREVILNHVKENGWIATLKAIKEVR